MSPTLWRHCIAAPSGTLRRKWSELEGICCLVLRSLFSRRTWRKKPLDQKPSIRNYFPIYRGGCTLYRFHRLVYSLQELARSFFEILCTLVSPNSPIFLPIHNSIHPLSHTGPNTNLQKGVFRSLIFWFNGPSAWMVPKQRRYYQQRFAYGFETTALMGVGGAFGKAFHPASSWKASLWWKFPVQFCRPAPGVRASPESSLKVLWNFVARLPPRWSLSEPLTTRIPGCALRFSVPVGYCRYFPLSPRPLQSAPFGAFMNCKSRCVFSHYMYAGVAVYLLFMCKKIPGIIHFSTLWIIRRITHQIVQRSIVLYNSMDSLQIDMPSSDKRSLEVSAWCFGQNPQVFVSTTTKNICVAFFSFSTKWKYSGILNPKVCIVFAWLKIRHWNYCCIQNVWFSCISLNTSFFLHQSNRTVISKERILDAMFSPATMLLAKDQDSEGFWELSKHTSSLSYGLVI